MTDSLWGTFNCFGIVQDAVGTIIAIISLVLFSALLTLAPWYSGIFLGDWFPKTLIYGGGIVAYALIALGAVVSRD